MQIATKNDTAFTDWLSGADGRRFTARVTEKARSYVGKFPGFYSSDIEDIVQEAIFRLSRLWPDDGFLQERTLNAVISWVRYWVLDIARARVGSGLGRKADATGPISGLRQMDPIADDMTDSLVSPTPSPEQTEIAKDEWHAYWKRLAPIERTVVSAIHEDDLTIKEAAQKLNISEGSVKSALFRARKKH